MNLKTSISRFTLLRLGACAVFAASAFFAEYSFAQDAKTLFEQSQAETNGCKKMVLACQAAKLDPKKYTDTCNSYRAPISRTDQAMKIRVLDSLSKGDFPGATRWVGTICNADDKQQLQAQIADEQKSKTVATTPQPVTPQPVTPKDNSGPMLTEARTAFSSGNLDGAVAAARQVTNPDLKPFADEIIGKVNSYRAAISQAKTSEGNKDIQGAINSYRNAQGINSNGPDNPGAAIARLEPLLHTAPPPQPPGGGTTPSGGNTTVAKGPTPPPPGPPKPVDVNAEVAKLLDEAGKAERGNNLQAALRAYDNALHLQAGNLAATSGKAAVLARINTDPAEQAKTLSQAIRSFYASKFTDAEDALRNYIDAPTAKSKGAAYFYLGATRLCGKILSGSNGQSLETVIASSEVQRPFKEARGTGYQPVQRLVAPVVMRAWRSAQ